MSFKPFMGLAFLGMLGFGAIGCSGPADPVAASSKDATVAPEATMSPEERDRIEKEAMKKQAEADRKAGRR